MAIRRTREQKQRAELRRAESESFQWGAGEEKVSSPRVRSTSEVKQSGTPLQSFLWKDLRRTATAILLGLSVLLGAWLALR